MNFRLVNYHFAEDKREIVVPAIVVSEHAGTDGKCVNLDVLDSRLTRPGCTTVAERVHRVWARSSPRPDLLPFWSEIKEPAQAPPGGEASP